METTNLVNAEPRDTGLIKVFQFLRKDSNAPVAMTEMRDFWKALTIEEKDQFKHEVEALG